MSNVDVYHGNLLYYNNVNSDLSISEYIAPYYTIFHTDQYRHFEYPVSSIIDILNLPRIIPVETKYHHLASINETRQITYHISCFEKSTSWVYILELKYS